MPEVTTGPESPAPAAKATQTRSEFNQQQLLQLDKTAQSCTAAQKPAYAAKLAARDISAAFVTQLLADVETCRTHATRAKEATDALSRATQADKTARADLLELLAEIQAAARQKYPKGAPQRGEFFAIARLDNVNRVRLEQVARALLEKLATESLPGITPAKISELPLRLQAYIDADSAQTTAQSNATTQRAERDALFKSITLRLNQLLNAADAEWPAHKPAHAPIRREFQLPPERAYRG